MLEPSTQYREIFLNVLKYIISYFEQQWNADYLVGLPYAGISLSTSISILSNNNIHMLLMRKKIKNMVLKK